MSLLSKISPGLDFNSTIGRFKEDTKIGPIRNSTSTQYWPTTDKYTRITFIVV